MTNTLSTTTVMPAATPTSSMPDVPPNGVWLVVGGPPPSDEAGCDGGGASVYDAKVYAIPIKCSIPQQRRSSRETKGECTYKRDRHT